MVMTVLGDRGRMTTGKFRRPAVQEEVGAGEVVGGEGSGGGLAAVGWCGMSLLGVLSFGRGYFLLSWRRIGDWGRLLVVFLKGLVFAWMGGCFLIFVLENDLGSLHLILPGELENVSSISGIQESSSRPKEGSCCGGCETVMQTGGSGNRGVTPFGSVESPMTISLIRFEVCAVPHHLGAAQRIVLWDAAMRRLFYGVHRSISCQSQIADHRNFVASRSESSASFWAVHSLGLLRSPAVSQLHFGSLIQ